MRAAYHFGHLAVHLLVTVVEPRAYIWDILNMWWRVWPKPDDIYTVMSVEFKPFDAHCCHMGAVIEHPMPDRVKPSLVIFDIRALWRSALSVRVPGCQKLQMTAYPVWHRMLYNCTQMATLGIKGLKFQLCCCLFVLSYDYITACLLHFLDVDWQVRCCPFVSTYR